MEDLEESLFSHIKVRPTILSNGTNGTNGNSNNTNGKKRGNCTKGTSKPRDNVLLGNGSACYRRVTQKTAVDPTMIAGGALFIKVIRCIAKKELMKCILTVDDAVCGKAFKNTQRVFRAGDSVAIIHSRVYEEYSASQVTTIQPSKMLCDIAEEAETETDAKIDITEKSEIAPVKAINKVSTNDMDKAQERKKKRQYGRKEKDSSNVWFVVTTAKHGRSRLWQRNMELLRLFLEFGDVEYVEVETAAVGMARDLARVYHSKGGDQHTCYQVQMTPGTALWIDETLFYTKVVGCEETKEQAKEEEDFFKTPEKEEEERDSRAEEETAEAVKSNECKECTDWTIWNCYELWDMFHEEETM